MTYPYADQHSEYLTKGILPLGCADGVGPSKNLVSAFAAIARGGR